MTREQLKLYQKVSNAENKVYIYFQKGNFKKMLEWQVKAQELRDQFNQEIEKAESAISA